MGGRTEKKGERRMHFKPSGDRFIIEPIKESTKVGHLYVPTNEDKNTQRAYIRAISVDIESSGMDWAIGDEVLTERFCGQSIPDGMVICGREEIMAKVVHDGK